MPHFSPRLPAESRPRRHAAWSSPARACLILALATSWAPSLLHARYTDDPCLYDGVCDVGWSKPVHEPQQARRRITTLPRSLAQAADDEPRPPRPPLQPTPGLTPDGTTPAAAARPSNCSRLLWFTAAAQQADGSIKGEYESMVIAAVMSAKQNAPSLHPYFIYSPHSNGKPPPSIVEWFARMGGTVIIHTLSFRSNLEAAVRAGRQPEGWLEHEGAFLRIDIPLVLKNVTFPPDAERDYVLYTDVDVLFESDVHACSLPKPRNMLLGSEHVRNTFANSGVLYINVTSLAEHHSGLIAWGDEHGWPGVMDQTLLLEYFKDGSHGGLQHLPDQYNWKGYWGDPAADGSYPIAILHFHGPKPMLCLECFVLHALNAGFCEHRSARCRSYAPLWNMAPDKGVYMGKVMRQFYMYHGLAEYYIASSRTL